MSEESKINLRATWLWLHRWTGIITLILMSVIGVTGSALVWPDATERMFYPSRFHVDAQDTRLTTQELFEAANAALPEGDQATAISLPQTSDRAVLVGGLPHESGRVGPPPRNRVWLDGSTGERVAKHDTSVDMMWWMRAVHGHLIIPGTLGRQVIGWFGVFLLILSLTGIWLWWPRNGKLNKSLTWKRAPTVSGRLHYRFGFWISIPMAILALSGAWISFPVVTTTAVSFLTGESIEAPEAHDHGPEPSAMLPMASPKLSINQAVALGKAQHGEGGLTFLALPTDGNPAWLVAFACGEEPTDCQKSYRIIDETGAVVAPPPPAPQSNGETVLEVMEHIHYADGYTVVWDVIVFIAGFLPILLGITGFLMWLRQRAGRIRVKQMKASAGRAQA